MKKSKLTQEEIHAENDARERLRAVERAIARAERIASETLAVASLVMQARTLRDVNATNETERVLADVGDAWIATHDELTERASHMAVNPQYYFEWSAEDMALAARRTLLDKILYGIREPKDGMATMSKIHALKWLENELRRRILGNFDSPTCTSMAHNAMKIAQRDEECRMLERLTIWIARIENTI